MANNNIADELGFLTPIPFEVDASLDSIEVLVPVTSSPTCSSVCDMPLSTCLWILCAATSVYTSKRLMVIHSYHYPLTISFRYYIVSLIVYIISLGLASRSTNSRVVAQGALQYPKWQNIWTFDNWMAVTAAAATAAISMPFLMEGLLHMPSLAVVVMLFPLAHIVDSLILTLCGSIPSITFPWEIISATIISAAILYDEYRLMVPGLVFSILGIVFAGVSRALLSSVSYKVGRERKDRIKICHAFSVMTLAFGILCSGSLSYLVEDVPQTYSLLGFNLTSALACVNTVSSILATFSNSPGAILFSPILLLTPSVSLSGGPLPVTNVFASACCCILVMILSCISFPVSFVSFFQIILFITSASLSIMFSTRSFTAVEYYAQRFEVGWGAGRPDGETSLRISGKTRIAPSIFRGAAAVTFALLFAWLFCSVNTAFIKSLPLSPLAQLDHSFAPLPSDRFDIVVSMYNEDSDSIKRMLSSIKATNPLKNLQPRVIVYTKHPTADTVHIKATTGADIVEKLENLGREGGTYLYHIVSKWEQLAEQTMFIQAHAHNMHELLPRINDFLVPRTGMLSLGFTGMLCDCQTCNDRWGWNDDLGIIPQVYQMVYNSSCTKPILLSYKGQFVASSRRIRGISIEIYRYLLDAITAKDGVGWSHDPSFIGNHFDSPDAPYLGYTVERLWNVLLQCSDLKVGTLCPSLLSRWRQGGQVTDCQCVDSEEY